jgi:hypothetical protein
MNNKWSDRGFRDRVERLAAQKGKTIPEVLKDAGLSPDYFRKGSPRGRNIYAIIKIANVLDVLPHTLMVFTIFPSPQPAASSSTPACTHDDGPDPRSAPA